MQSTFGTLFAWIKKIFLQTLVEVILRYHFLRVLGPPYKQKWYVYIEESFNTIFNMGYGGPTGLPPPHALCVEKITYAFKG